MPRFCSLILLLFSSTAIFAENMECGYYTLYGKLSDDLRKIPTLQTYTPEGKLIQVEINPTGPIGFKLVPLRAHWVKIRGKLKSDPKFKGKLVLTPKEVQLAKQPTLSNAIALNPLLHEKMSCN